MAHFIFQKNSNNIEGTLFRIAENESDLNNLNINKNDYTIIEDNNVNFDNLKLNKINVVKYNNNTVIFNELNIIFNNLEFLQIYVNNFKNQLKVFLENNLNHPSFTQWNSYHNQLNNLNYNNFVFPFTLSLEQYFKNNNQPYYSILQIP